MDDEVIIARIYDLRKEHRNDRKRYLFELSKLMQYNGKCGPGWGVVNRNEDTD